MTMALSFADKLLPDLGSQRPPLNMYTGNYTIGGTILLDSDISLTHPQILQRDEKCEIWVQFSIPLALSRPNFDIERYTYMYISESITN